MSTWIVKVKAAVHLEPVIIGNIDEAPSDGRAKIVGIARGRVVVEVQGKWFDWADSGGEP